MPDSESPISPGFCVSGPANQDAGKSRDANLSHCWVRIVVLSFILNVNGTLLLCCCWMAVLLNLFRHAPLLTRVVSISILISQSGPMCAVPQQYTPGETQVSIDFLKVSMQLLYYRSLRSRLVTKKLTTV